VNWVDPSGLAVVGAVINFTKKSWNHIVKRHVSRNTFPGKSKFSKPSSIEKNARRTVNKPDKTTCQSNGNTLYEKDFGRTVGTNGETVQRVVVDESGNVVTTFPSSSITAAGILDLIGSMLDPFDLISGGLADDGSDML